MITYAFCTYNRADRLERLVAALRAQDSPVPFEILAVNNNSRDDTLTVLERLAALPGVPLRFVTESAQGIVPARNRALAESMDSEIMIFIDDDELPLPGIVAAAHHAISVEGAQCAGGRVEVDFSDHGRPRWLRKELLGFLAEVDHGPDALWITDHGKAVWTANIAYDMAVFRADPSLRFDRRFNREGSTLGGGEDVAMFDAFLQRGLRIRYRPDMHVLHGVEAWRLHRRYFLKLHYGAGIRAGLNDPRSFDRTLGGVPLFAFTQLLSLAGRSLRDLISLDAGWLRRAMNVTHAFGQIVGYRKRHLESERKALIRS